MDYKNYEFLTNNCKNFQFTMINNFYISFLVKEVHKFFFE